MEPIEAIVRFNLEGQVTPLRFTWQKVEYQVESSGRRWGAEDGEHFLVMVPGGRIFELLFVSSDGHWYLQPVSTRRMVA